MSAIYKKGEIVWAKIQGYSWWPGRITKIKLKLCIRKDRLGKYILKYEKEPYFYITFFPNDSISKVKLKYMKKFIDGYKLRAKTNKRKKLERAIDIATKTFLEENPNLNIDIKRNIFNIKLYSKKKFPLLRQFRSLEEEEEEQNGENDIQSFIDSEINECEKYKNELKVKKNKNKYIGNKRKKPNEEKDDTKSFISESINEFLDKEEDINKKCNKELKKFSNELYKSSVEIKRKNTFNNIINVFNNIENIINKYDIDYNFNIIKDLLFILNNYNNHNNEDIMNKSISLHKDLICKYLNKIFKCDNDFLEKESLYSESLFNDKINNNSSKVILDMEEMGNKIAQEIDNLKNKVFRLYSRLNEEENKNKNDKDIINNNIKNEDNTQLDNKKISLIYNDNNNSMNNNNNNFKSYNNYNFEINQELNDEKTVNNNIDYEFLKDGNNNQFNNKYGNIEEEIGNNDSFNNNEPFLKDIINNPNYFNKKPEGKLYPDNFFNEIYLKEGITKENKSLRKKMCLQLYGVLQLALPYCQKKVVKNNVIYLEYLARNKDPLFGNKYKIIINMIYNRIKSEAVKIKNKK